MKPGISAVIVAHNQADLLTSCLKSIVDWVDEIIVIDLESNEDIKSLASSFKAKYHLHKHVDIVEKVRQESLQYAKHQYVLFLDPDETIPESLAKTLQRLLVTQPIFIKMPRRNYVFGKWIEHAQWWPDYQTRLFQKSAITWPQTLHAQPTILGSGVTLDVAPENAIHHTNYTSVDQWAEKNQRYAKAHALELVGSDSRYTLLDAITKSVGEISGRFFRSAGYKDGMHGLFLSIFQSFYHFQVYAYYWEAKKYASIEDEGNIKSFPRVWFSHGLSEVLFWDKSKSFAKTIKEKFVRRMIG